MAYHNSRPRTPEVCPVCGEDVPPRALACPECGADHRSGWREEEVEEEFSYDEFVAREFGPRREGSRLKPIWWITAVVLLAALLATIFFL
jgi:hypothetical protein